jgi:fatty-acyl-CoA synthase
MTDLGIGSWPARRARMSPERIAFRQGARTRTYAELAARVDSLAAAFAQRGVRSGDRVAHLGPNDIATFETFFAAARLGAVFAPMNTRLAPPEIAYLIEDSAPALLVYGAESADLVGRLDDTPPLVSIDEAARVRDAESFEQLVADGGSGPHVDVSLDDDAVILYTSGTTGRPKGAVLTHANLTFNTVNQLAHIDVLSTDVVLCTAPLFHATGLSQVSLPVLFKGGTVVVAPRFDAAWLLRTVAELGITAFSAVPTMLQMLVDHSDWDAADLHTLRYVNYGGSAVAERVARAWLARGVTVVQGYGMTETSPGVTMERPDRPAEQPVSAGVAHFFTDIALLGPDGVISEARGTGELLVRGPNVFRGYRNRPADTAAVFTDGWFRTGDVARLDPDGNAYIVDRVKDLIISGGENIYPGEVEAAITALPDVLDAAVVAVPDETWGEVGAAYVVRRAGASAEETTIRAQLAERLARFKIPKYVRFVDELPRTATGKIQRARLRSEFGADQERRLPDR